MDTGVFFVVHVWRDARGFHATARDVMCEHDNEFDKPARTGAVSRRALLRSACKTTTGDEG